MNTVLFSFERDMPTVSMMRDEFIYLSSVMGFRVLFKPIVDIKSEDITTCDVLILIRPNDVLSAAMAQRAHKAGCFVATFCDDDLLSLPSDLPTIPWRKQGLINTLAASEIILSSSIRICEKYRPMTASGRLAIINTMVKEDDLAELKNEKRILDRKIIKIVYAANAGHAALFNEYIMPVMPRLCEKYAQRISMTLIGVRPDLSAYSKLISITYKASMPLQEYRYYMAQQHFDIGIAPLHGDAFSKCKYFNKFIEYTLSGITGVYSNTKPYTDIVQQRQNGFLADNTEESWFEILCDAIDAPSLRRTCVETARTQILRDFSPEAIVHKLIEDIPELCRGNIKKKSSSESLFFVKLWYFLSRPLDWLYLTGFYLKKTGITGLINKVKSHLREKRAYAK